MGFAQTLLFFFVGSQQKKQKMALLTMILGCMFSGKSTELMNQVSRLRAVGASVLVVNHTFDSRCSNEVKTHAGSRMPAVKTTSLSNVNVGTYDVIGVDEAQFFKDLHVVLDWVEAGKDVYVAGLSGDFQRKPFGVISSLIPHADRIQVKQALCMACGEPAAFSKRVVCSDEKLLVGGKDQYVAACRRHFS
jgi:thymidine kinase